MNLEDFLANREKPKKGERTGWLPFRTFDVTTGSLWAGDPHLGNADDGCVVRVPPGRYVVEGVGLGVGRYRVVGRLRVRPEGGGEPELGGVVGETGTDSAMIGVCDIAVFEAAYEGQDPDALTEAFESQTRPGFGAVTLAWAPGAVMPFVPTGSDGTGPVRALVEGGRAVGIELSFEGEGEG